MPEVLDFSSFLQVDEFVKNSVLNDTKFSSGAMRLNRFVGVMDLKMVKKKFTGLGHNNDIEAYGNDFLAWNIFKINCPALTINIETKEVDMIPRHYFKNWENSVLEVSFLESADMKIRHYFFEWMDSALHSVSYVRNYYDDIKADWFAIYPLTGNGLAERYEMFYDLVPFEINSINFDVSDTGDQSVLTTVKFKYVKHRVLSLRTSWGSDYTQSTQDKKLFGKP